MNRRRFVAAAIASTLLSTTAARADYVEDIVKLLGRQGYVDIEVTRTLLGRVRIVAEKDGLRRELICNPRTGEILRDISSGGRSGSQTAGSSESGSGGNGSGGGDDNDENDDDHEGRGGGDDDNSGHGGGSDDDNSGHGGDDDKSGRGGGDDD